MNYCLLKTFVRKRTFPDLPRGVFNGFQHSIDHHFFFQMSHGHFTMKIFLKKG